MFHVKHPTPEEIAFSVRGLLEDAVLDAIPSPARAHFIERMAAFAELLALWGERFNLTAEPRNADEIAFHIVDSLIAFAISRREDSPIADAFMAGAEVLDLGSGAGFPGLVLAAASQAHFRLTESRRKRVSFLGAAVHRMGLANVTIDPTHRTASDFASGFHTVTARAFGPAAEVYHIAARALRSGGCAVLYANPTQPLVPEKASEAGLTGHQRISYSAPRGGRPTPRTLAIWRKT